ncbi:MAG TPA: hypothetical protein VKU00_24835 [Chthonomonadaceae bacterium]|nr:hypothetical protein [Chthonomonadaceae bacterium]
MEICQSYAKDRSAIILHTWNVSKERLLRVIQTLGGAAEWWVGEPIAQDDLTYIPNNLSEYRRILLEEAICRRSVVELVVQVKADAKTRDIPLWVLSPGSPSDFTLASYFAAGVAGVVRLENAVDLTHFSQIAGRSFQEDFTEPARRAVNLAEREANRLDGHWGDPEHFLYALLGEPPSAASHILQQEISLTPEGNRLRR